MNRAALTPFALFFLSGASGLVYEVVWVREFGAVFGNTVHSAALVTAVFMLGLGAGSYLAGVWADRRGPAKLLAAYGWSEVLIGVLGAALALVLPKLGAVSAAVSSYRVGAHGWSELSPASEALRFAIAALLLAPITLLMGGTLALLVRRVVASDLDRAGVRVGALYGLNTAGAAIGCFLTDFALVPRLGLRDTQLASVAVDVAVGIAAIALAKRGEAVAGAAMAELPPTSAKAGALVASLAALALALTGFAGMGLEIVWLRLLISTLGSYRAVFSILLTVILFATWIGSTLGGWLHRRLGKPETIFIVALGLFVAATLGSLAAFDRTAVDRLLVGALRDSPDGVDAGLSLVAQTWPMLRVVAGLVGLPAALMGCSYPLANAIVQRVEAEVGRRAGALYLANTLGAVLGALLVGFVLLPGLGAQGALLACVVAAAAAVVPLGMSTRKTASAKLALAGSDWVFAGVTLALIVAISGWGMLLPETWLRDRSMPELLGDRLLTVSEGPNELLAVSVNPDGGRRLWTNGHSMSVTTPDGQRYMRAFAHVPLLAREDPKRVLVICFGVGNTVHAASLHPSVDRIDVADLSRNVLEHATWFAATNHRVLEDPRVHVFVNDGRLHLRMQPPGTYDLVTLEPPPIAHAGVAPLYSKEFYELVRSRLTPSGVLTQWLPIDQLQGREVLSLVRAFVDVFPDAVLLSGERHDLILMGSPSGPVTLDPADVARRLAARPAVAEDLVKVDLGRLSELIGTFAGDAATLRRAVEHAAPVTDDAPTIEYSISSKVFSARIPKELFDVGKIASFCPACRAGDAPPGLGDLDAHLAILGRLYADDAFLRVRTFALAPVELSIPRLFDGGPPPGVAEAILRSGYLQRVVGIDSHGLPSPLGEAGSARLRAFVAAHPDEAVASIRLGLAELAGGRADAAVAPLRRAVELAPASTAARFGLARAMLAVGDAPGAVVAYQRALEIAPSDVAGRLGLIAALIATRRGDLVEPELGRVLALDPGNGQAHRLLCIAALNGGALSEARRHCAAAIAGGATLEPQLAATVFGH